MIVVTIIVTAVLALLTPLAIEAARLAFIVHVQPELKRRQANALELRERIRSGRGLSGPFNLWLIGYLPFITAMPHKHFVQLAKKYSSLFK